ncbi:MAG: aldehyde ferredoxin oxidoreductase N-terminal domain-containing protein [Caldilineaceae bacterium]
MTRTRCKYVFDNGPDVEPFSPDNLLCVMNGPLTGTDVNMSGRLAVVTSLVDRTIADSHMKRGLRLSSNGPVSTVLVFKGKADKPTYAYVEDGKVTLHDASDLWGMGVHDTLRILRERHGEDCDGMAIGQAGENLVGWPAGSMWTIAPRAAAPVPSAATRT